MIINSINVLEVIKNDGKTVQFREKDIVKIDCSRADGVEGKIDYIDTISLTIDASVNYKSRILEIKFRDIKDIRLKD